MHMSLCQPPMDGAEQALPAQARPVSQSGPLTSDYPACGAKGATAVPPLRLRMSRLALAWALDKAKLQFNAQTHHPKLFAELVEHRPARHG